MNIYSKLACLGGGMILGALGVKVLGSKDAKRAYVHATAAGLRIKDGVMQTVTDIQEQAADIVASAKDLNEARAEQEAEQQAQNEIFDEESDVDEIFEQADKESV